MRSHPHDYPINWTVDIKISTGGRISLMAEIHPWWPTVAHTNPGVAKSTRPLAVTPGKLSHLAGCTLTVTGTASYLMAVTLMSLSKNGTFYEHMWQNMCGRTELRWGRWGIDPVTHRASQCKNCYFVTGTFRRRTGTFRLGYIPTITRSAHTLTKVLRYPNMPETANQPKLKAKRQCKSQAKVRWLHQFWIFDQRLVR